MLIKKEVKEKKITLSVSVDVDSEMTETEKRDILKTFLSLTHDVYRELGMQIHGEPRPFRAYDGNWEEILQHFGIEAAEQEGETSIFDSTKLAEQFTVLSYHAITQSPRRFIIDFDPNFPFSVLRQISKKVINETDQS